METLDWCGYREKISKICIFVLTWSTNVTDTHTDRQTNTHTQTPHDGIGRTYALHHAAKADRNRTGIKKNQFCTSLVSVENSHVRGNFQPESNTMWNWSRPHMTNQPTNQRHYLQRLSQYLHVLIATRSEKLIPATQPTRSLAVLNILLSHSKVTQGHSKWLRWVGRVYIPISISLKLCLYVVPFMRYSASKNGVTLILGVGVVQSHWKWHRLIDHIRLSIGRPL